MLQSLAVLEVEHLEVGQLPELHLLVLQVQEKMHLMLPENYIDFVIGAVCTFCTY